MNWPRNGTWGYWISYPLMIATLGAIALGFLTVGMVLNLVEAAIERRRRRGD